MLWDPYSHILHHLPTSSLIQLINLINQMSQMSQAEMLKHLATELEEFKNKIGSLSEGIKGFDEGKSKLCVKIVETEKPYGDFTQQEIVDNLMKGNILKFPSGSNLLLELSKCKKTAGVPYTELNPLVEVFMNLFKGTVLDHFLIVDQKNNTTMLILVKCKKHNVVKRIILRESTKILDRLLKDTGFFMSYICCHIVDNVTTFKHIIDLEAGEPVYDRLNNAPCVDYNKIIENLHKNETGKKFLEDIYSRESFDSLKAIALKNEYKEQEDISFLKLMTKKMPQDKFNKLINMALLTSFFLTKELKYISVLFNPTSQSQQLGELMMEHKSQRNLMKFLLTDKSIEDMVNVIKENNDYDDFMKFVFDSFKDTDTFYKELIK